MPPPEGEYDIVIRGGTLHPPRVVADLPAGGKRMIQEADGYAVPIISGVVTYRDGVPTGALPGRLVRGGGSQVTPHVRRKRPASYVISPAGRN